MPEIRPRAEAGLKGAGIVAVGTGMGTHNKDNAGAQKALSPEQKERLARARRPMEIANGFRLFFFCLSISGVKYGPGRSGMIIPFRVSTAFFCGMFF